jgi:transcription elongation factor GreA
MEDGKTYLTKEKFDELTLELEDLKKNRRKEIAEQLQYARSLGDLSENGEYHEARDEQAKIEARISQLEESLKHAEIVKHKAGDTVEVGSTVTIQKTAGKDGSQTYAIVSPEEADMSSGKISYQSPLGSALIGKKKKEEFSFKSPKGNIKYKIVDVK